ncbi:MAG: hypothetical protein NZ550_00415 [Fimbriimonadales bacterium]|nr:hypothetical protein [Fimbriimonadales bacterium]
MSETKRLLVLACSARKRKDAELLPAIERYDGIFYRVLRRWWQHAPASERRILDILILSAEFGLIEAQTLIPYYDRKMTPKRADELAPKLIATLQKRAQTVDYQEVLLAMGSVYLRALTPVEQWLPHSILLKRTSGGIGTQAAQLRAWLHRVLP